MAKYVGIYGGGGARRGLECVHVGRAAACLCLADAPYHISFVAHCKYAIQVLSQSSNRLSLCMATTFLTPFRRTVLGMVACQFLGWSPAISCAGWSPALGLV